MCSRCDFEVWIETIEDMQDETSYAWAIDTLDGIHKWVLSNEHITQNQKDAITNIENSVCY